MKEVQIHPSWKKLLATEFEKGYFQELRQFLVEEKKHYTIYPPGKKIFACFDRTPVEEVKVVILGQDPYHGPGQANGLCFSVSDGIQKPPSLNNIFKEIQDDLNIPIPTSGNLEPWADQGVLLLNATLTVRARSAGSHQRKGWELFTDHVIQRISDEKDHLVFLLWGNFARSKTPLIDQNKHVILSAPHPSPLARGGFFGCKHFSRTNQFLESKGLAPIDWKIE
ncbi:MAG: uracil-DNA glycosylase [Bacteroidetes bacterium]|nr:MAG: uracil-DNA glycosylase [Bacteroidota bacterium]